MTYEKKQYLNALLVKKAEAEIKKLEKMIETLKEERRTTFLTMTETLSEDVEAVFRKYNEKFGLTLNVKEFKDQIEEYLHDVSFNSRVNSQEKFNTDIKRLEVKVDEIKNMFFSVKNSEFSLKALELFAENEEACKLSTLRKIAKDTNI